MASLYALRGHVFSSSLEPEPKHVAAASFQGLHSQALLTCSGVHAGCS